MLNIQTFDGLAPGIWTEKPSLTLDFYSYGILLTKRSGSVETTYPVAASEITKTAAANINYNTGLLNEQVIYIAHTGTATTVVEYRKPQLSTLWLEGCPDALRIPLPGLLLLRTRTGQQQPSYKLFAVKRKPRTLSEPLWHPPLPNIFNSANICWGTVRINHKLADYSLQADWQALLSTAFGNHETYGRSQTEGRDIRKFLLALHDRQAKRYPLKDLMPHNRTDTLERLLR